MGKTITRSLAEWNNAAGCRLLAAGNMAEAAARGVGNRKLRLEHSAAVWVARAEMLERLDRKRAIRLAAAAA